MTIKLWFYILKTGLGFTPLLPNCTIKVDFELSDPKFFFMSPTYTDLKISFENAILKIPRYSLETSLYEALVQKMEHNPLQLCWNSNEVLVYTIGKGVTQDIINLHCKPTRLFVGLLGMNKKA